MKIFYHEREPSVLPPTNINNKKISDNGFVTFVKMWFVVESLHLSSFLFYLFFFTFSLLPFI